MCLLLLVLTNPIVSDSLCRFFVVSRDLKPCRSEIPPGGMRPSPGGMRPLQGGCGGVVCLNYCGAALLLLLLLLLRLQAGLTRILPCLYFCGATSVSSHLKP